MVYAPDSPEQRKYTVSKTNYMNNYCEYEFRKCGNSWRYCDGKCYQCATTLMTTSAGTIELQRSDSSCSSKTGNGGDFH